MPAKTQLWIYLILTPLLSLGLALLIPLPVVLIALLMLFIPPILAITLSALSEGGRGVSQLFKQLLQWRISWKWYVISLGLPFSLILLASLLAVLLGWSPNLRFIVPESTMLITNSVFVPLVAIFEEFGWRGFALPRLLTQRSPFVSALIIGVAWGILHIGLGLVDGRPWLPTFLVPLAASFAYTWLFVRTGGSLGMVILYHFAMDYAPQFLLFNQVSLEQGIWLQTIVNSALALALILLSGVFLRRGAAAKPVVTQLG